MQENYFNFLNLNLFNIKKFPFLRDVLLVVERLRLYALQKRRNAKVVA